MSLTLCVVQVMAKLPNSYVHAHSTNQSTCAVGCVMGDLLQNNTRSVVHFRLISAVNYERYWVVL